MSGITHALAPVYAALFLLLNVGVVHAENASAPAGTTDTTGIAVETPVAAPASAPKRRLRLRRPTATDQALDSSTVSPTKLTLSPELLAAREANQTRRTMMKWHQGFGLTTVGLVFAQAAVGTPLYFPVEFEVDKETRETLKTVHLTLGITSFVTWSTAGTFAFMAPEAAVSAEDDGFNRVALHKLFALGHTIGMLVLPIMGAYISDPTRFKDNPTTDDYIFIEDVLKPAHVGLGYFTAAMLAGGMFSILF